MTPATEFVAAPPSASSTTPTPTATGPDDGAGRHRQKLRPPGRTRREAMTKSLTSEYDRRWPAHGIDIYSSLFEAVPALAP
jgi:hypothetical protein